MSNKRNSNRVPSGMTLKTALCGVAASTGLTTFLVLTGVRMVSNGSIALDIISAILGGVMLLAMLFSAWSAGRASQSPSRDHVEPLAPRGDPNGGRTADRVNA
ncbi:hypothetical protein [Sphingomonas sp. 3-13AW]|uniref:hypothetical protein n=1 Tax=Sphingomonas sp. 3-13AW TaxID=3050450 RepID=UPI003BB52BCD